ncbi:MAG: hypothetical protein ONB23_03500 [candidate division KSB1 bacterium]|nr:hypothetical protein [candidate division KSB1 bacterium]
MVKINLMGPEEPGEPQPKERAPEEPHEEILSPVPDEDFGEVEPPPKKGWGWPVLTVIGAAAILVVVWLFLQGRGRGTKVPPLTGLAEKKAETAAMAPAEAKPPAPSAAEPSGAPPVAGGPAEPVSASPLVTSVRVPTVAAAKDMSTVLRIATGGAQFGLVSRADGAMVVELIARTDADLDAARQAFLAAFPGAQLKAQTRDAKVIAGETFRQEILSLSLPAPSVQVTGQLQFFDKSKAGAQLRELAGQVGLSVRALESAPPVEEEQLRKTPMLFRAVGSKEAVSRFLEELGRAGWNLRVTKALLVPTSAYPAGRDGRFTLVLQMDLCEAK